MLKTVTLALQGGGTHGAFTWGVLDRLLEDERLAIEGISATSAGAINGALAVSGLASGGRDAARALLARFWGRMAEWSLASPLQPTPLDRISGSWGLSWSPAYQWGEAMMRLLAPAQVNPLGVNPLRGLLSGLVDYGAVRANPSVRLFVSATNVRSGRLRIFEPAEIDEEVILASTCLPHLFPAVEIAGEHYWDGGYVANPAIYPLMRHCKSSEVVIVQVNPIGTREVPATADSILHRINEISFNASVMREMHALAFITGLHDRGWIDRVAGIRKTHIHLIHHEELMTGLHASSKFNAEPAFLEMLFHAGRDRAEAWLAEHYEAIGQRSTIDVSEVYL
ncbi:MAG: patatin-like phospholipase family protein [Pseudomonadota bacterium]